MFGIVLFQMMIPVQIFIIPQYVMVSKLHITNTALGLLFPGLVTAFGTFLLRQAYMGLSRDLEEAARLDGCNIPQTFLFVMAPLAKSSMAALISCVPMIILYIIFQKQFIEGIATSGGKL